MPGRHGQGRLSGLEGPGGGRAGRERAAPNDPKLRAGRAVWQVSALAGTPRVATAIAEEASQVLRLPTDALRELMKNRELKRSSARGWPSALMITDRALFTLRNIVQVSMIINVFLLFNEVFKEFYTDSVHVASSKYLYFGLPRASRAQCLDLDSGGLQPDCFESASASLSRSLRWLNTRVCSPLSAFGLKGNGLGHPGLCPHTPR